MTSSRLNTYKNNVEGYILGIGYLTDKEDLNLQGLATPYIAGVPVIISAKDIVGSTQDIEQLVVNSLGTPKTWEIYTNNSINGKKLNQPCGPDLHCVSVFFKDSRNKYLFEIGSMDYDDSFLNQILSTFEFTN